MAGTETTRGGSEEGRWLFSVSMPMRGVGPEALLSLGRGGPRGFWAREGRWIAHIGSVATIQAGVDATDVTRFRSVWNSARALTSGWLPGAGPDEAPVAPRFFGGFSFSANHGAEGIWDGFPSAHFVLPAVELVGGAEGGTLFLRARGTSAESGPVSDRALKEALAATARRLEEYLSDSQANPASPPPVLLESDPEAWATAVRRSLAEFSEGGLSKVVLARVMTASFPRPLDPVEVGMRLWRGNPRSHVFLYEPRAGRVLLGAAPETVSTVSRGVFRATAVAGSTAPGRDSREQMELAAALLNSEKDRREHRVGVDDMVSRLAEIAVEVRGDPEPHVLTLSGIQHLETVITARLHGGETVISALEALHPTPAVCGFPRERALEFLRSEEPFQRGWYAGPVGWFDTEGDGVFVPALRSAVSSHQDWHLFAGAGIVAGSDPEREWAETRIKFGPVLRALGEGEGSWASAAHSTHCLEGRNS